MTDPIDKTIEVDRHYGIGPLPDMYHHGPVTLFTVHDPEMRGNSKTRAVLYACLDCGFVTDDSRQFLHEDCEILDNGPINESWRDYLAENDYPGDITDVEGHE